MLRARRMVCQLNKIATCAIDDEHGVTPGRVAAVGCKRQPQTVRRPVRLSALPRAHLIGTPARWQYPDLVLGLVVCRSSIRLASEGDQLTIGRNTRHAYEKLLGVRERRAPS